MQPKPFHPGKTAFVAAVLLAAFIYTYFIRTPPHRQHPAWRGTTMGTTYAVRIARSPLDEEALKALRERIEACLESINAQMSTYREDSEISRFNRHISTEPFPVSGLFADLTARALALSEATGGAFDPTVAPLLAAWGFGSGKAPADPPDEEVKARLRQVVGHGLLTVNPSGHLVKKVPGLQLDLSAMAKGAGVDALAALLEKAGCSDFFVEIGGEVAARGLNPDGVPWRIGIEAPVANSFQGEHLYGIVQLSGRALATSGDYRNYRRFPDGRLASHILDPRRGEPVIRTLASATVLAGDCATADAAATALMVMGVEEGLAWIESREELEALFIVHASEGGWTRSMSPGFAAATKFEALDTAEPAGK